MTILQMKYFLAVARTRNLTRAAEKLYISQPALSKQISAIERELNMQLLLREHKRIRLTPAGLMLADRFPELIRQYEELIEQALAVNSGHTGSLIISVI